MHYMIYLLDEKGWVDQSIHLMRSDDQTAIDAVISYPHSNVRELWQGKRLVYKDGGVPDPDAPRFLRDAHGNQPMI
jgi:hypothetical protein